MDELSYRFATKEYVQARIAEAMNVAGGSAITAADEGKVVSGGVLVAQTAHAQITANGTYDTTLNNSVEVAVPAETVYWNSYTKLPYWKDTVYPLTTLPTQGYYLREANAIESFSAPEATEIAMSYLIYDSSVKTVSFPKLETITAGVSRVFGRAMSLETMTIGSVGHGFQTLAGAANMFYQMGSLQFTVNIYCTGDNVDGFLNSIRNNGGTIAICNFYASESTTYNGSPYSAGDLMLKSEVA